MTRQDRTWVVVLVVAVLLVLIAIAGIGREPNAPLDHKAERGTTQRDARAVSAPIALTVLGVVGTLVGTLGGVWWGQLLEDERRRRGEVRREVRAWADETTNTAGDTETRIFDMRFFNDRDVNIALWDVKVECYREGSLIDTIFPRPGPVPQPMPTPPEELEPIDLESRKSVYISLELVAEGEELSLLKSADQLQFVATMMPDDEKVSKPLPAWDDLEEST
jgi:hypothetical protein